MPELPEVETVRTGLEAAVLGRRLVEVVLRRPDLRWPIPTDLPKRASGARVIAVRRRSKYLILDEDNGETLILHLGMSGRIRIDGHDVTAATRPASGDEKHDHVVFLFEGGIEVRFNDARRFGMLDIASTAKVEHHERLARIGPEPLGNAFHASYLHTRFKGLRSPVKSALLDQKIVAGLGNIYVNEALSRSGISPMRRAGRISADRLEPLVRDIRDVLNEAIAAGGSSLRDHRQTSGELGYFQHNFRVYDRAGQQCPTKGCSGTIRRVVQSGRSTFYCAQCQR